MNDGQVPVQCHPDEEENGKDCDVEGDDVTDQTDHLVALVRHLEVERDVEGDVEAHQKVRHGQGRHEQVVWSLNERTIGFLFSNWQRERERERKKENLDLYVLFITCPIVNVFFVLKVAENKITTVAILSSLFTYRPS